MQRKAAFELVASREGISVGAASQRYYVARRRDEPAAGRSTPRRRPAAGPVNVDGTAASKIEQAAALLLEAIELLPATERDAQRWRAVAAIVDA